MSRQAPDPAVSAAEEAAAAGAGDYLSLTESAARRVADMIANGTFKPGQRLPAERELAGLLGLSRGALREALRTLEAVGLVRARVGSGRYVTASRVDDPTGGLGIWMQLQPIGDVIALRRILEPSAIRAIPGLRLDETAEEAAAAYGRMQKALGARNPVLATRIHTEFHLALARYATSRLHRVLLASLIKAAESSQLEIFRTPRAGDQSLVNHRPIVNALQARDVEGAAAAVVDHLTPVFVYVHDGDEP